ncbi:MAG: HU family DNA-binding protein [Paludibacteraceae bacterium]|nr:HU family DNA-binding protein [Paludibacteraceae bacterium]
MADNKLSWTELRKALASRAATNEKEAKLFLDSLNKQITEGLKQDKQVKINGIGTFRIQSVAPRASVNVSTGERITIEGYDKVVFTPEAGIKELIEHNTPMKKKNAKRNATEVNPLQKLGEQADEIVGILSDLGQSPVDEKKNAAQSKDKKAAAEKTSAKNDVAVAAEQSKEEPKAPVVTEKAATPENVAEQPAENPVEKPIEKKTEAPKAAEAPKATEAPKKKYHFLRDTIICVVILLLLLLVGYFFLRHQISGWLDSLDEPKPVKTEQVAVAKKQPTVVEKTPEAPKEIVYDRLITTEPMHKHSRLAWMAWRYYGNKDLWVYLYDANKDHIVNPDKITTGTPIRVPDLTPEQKDTTLESTRQILKRLTEQGEAAKRR